MNRPTSRSVSESSAFEQFGEHGPLKNSFQILSSMTTTKDTLSLLTTTHCTAKLVTCDE